MSVRKKFEHWLGETTGLVTSCLKEDFVSGYNPEEGISDKVVFSGPYQLPTKLQVKNPWHAIFKKDPAPMFGCS